MEEIKAIVVDDSKTILFLQKSYLEELDIDTEIFSNPLEAIEYLKNNKVDLLFLDYVMPQMNGLEFFEKIKPFFDGMVVMVTSIGEAELKLKAFEMGAVEFINKPIVKAEFLATARNLAQIIMHQKMLEDEKVLIQAEVQRQISKIKQQEIEILKVLAVISEYRDENTYLHVKRVAEYSKILAKACGMDEKEAELIYLAAPLHDIGKIGIRDKVLLKTDKLTEEEYEIMKSHTTIGYDILKHSSSPVLQMGAKIALTHHERWDGLGYPRGLKGEEIPFCGRIVAVADVFDALTTVRPYKKPWDLAEALNFVLDNAGLIFDPFITDKFLESSEEIFKFYKESENENFNH